MNDKENARKYAIAFWKNFLAYSDNSDKIKNHLQQWLSQNRHIRRVLTYLPLHTEIDTLEILASFKDLSIFVPQLIEDHQMIFRQITPGSIGNFPNISKGPKGVYEPDKTWPDLKLPLGEQDLMIVPGLGLNPSGFRLGRGGGYYDRFVAKNNAIYKIMLLPHQLCTLEFIENKYDLKPDLIITQSTLITDPNPCQ